MTEFHHADRSGHAASEFDISNRTHREETNRARQAAEALFAPKQRVTEPATPAPLPADEQSVRKPRILSAVPAQPVGVEPVQITGKRLTPTNVGKIPTAHLPRIRTWLKYGMKVAQVAQLYGVSIGDIESILKNA